MEIERKDDNLKISVIMEHLKNAMRFLHDRIHATMTCLPDDEALTSGNLFNFP